MSTKPDREAGAALISALLLVALMTSIALALASDMRYAMRRSANLDIRDQAYWYGLGARDYAEALLGRALDEPDTAFRPDASWLTGSQVFPIEDGQLVGQIRDGNNCFNINSVVVRGENNLLVEDPRQRRRFEMLMQALGVPLQDASLIAAQAIDWIDSDTRPVLGGAEDDAYDAPVRGYRTGNTLMAEREELLSLAAMTPAIYQALEPLVCARPVAEHLPTNINTLTLDQTPLLMAMFEGELSRSDAEGVLIRRPQAGYAAITEFWSDPVMVALEPDMSVQSIFGLTTNYFEIEINVLYAGMRFELFEIVEWRGENLRRLSQRYGSFS